MNSKGCDLLMCPKFGNCDQAIGSCLIHILYDRMKELEEEIQELKAYKPRIGEYSNDPLLKHLEYDYEQVNAGIEKAMKQPLPPEYFAEYKQGFIDGIRKNFEIKTGNTPTFEVIKDGNKEIRYRSEYAEYLENELFERNKKE